MTEYYDLVLGLVPLALIGVTGSLSALGWTLTSAVTLAGLLSILVVAHALFVNGPVDDRPSVPDQSASNVSFNSAD